MVFSNDMEYDEQLKQGAYYATIGKTNTLYNCFREEGQNSFPIQKRYHPVTPEDEEILLRDNNVPQYKNNSDYKTNCKAERQQSASVKACSVLNVSIFSCAMASLM